MTKEQLLLQTNGGQQVPQAIVTNTLMAQSKVIRAKVEAVNLLLNSPTKAAPAGGQSVVDGYQQTDFCSPKLPKARRLH